MKKLIAYVVLLTMCITGFAACSKEPASNTNTGAVSDLTAAGNYIYAMYKDSAVNTATDYKVVSVVKIGTTTYQIDWSTDAASGITIKAPENNMVTVDVDEKSPSEVSYNLIATIKDASGETVTKKFPHILPAYKEFSFAEYVAAKDDETVVVKGVITAMLSKDGKGNSSNSIYFQDNDGGYYVYNLADDPYTVLGLKEGMTIRATGVRDTYSGTYEVINTTIEVLDNNVNVPAPVDFTEIYTNAEALTDAALVGPQSMLVTIKGVEITTQDTSNGYYRFKLAGKESYVRISSSSCPIVKADQAVMIDNHTKHAGYLADVTGLICVYNGAFYLTPVSADAFSNFRLAEKTDAEKVEYEAGNIVIDDILADTKITLNANGATYKDVAITYEVSGDAAVYADGVLTVTLLEDASTITVKATVTCGAETKVVELTVPVDAMATDVYVANKVEEPAADTAYKFSVAQNNVGKTLYFAGEVSDRYLVTTDKADKAVDVFVEVVDGAYRLYFTKDGVKTYIEAGFNDANKMSVKLTDTPTITYTWNADFDTFVTNVDGTDYYLGCYNQFETISASKTSYINADNVDVSQFPARIVTLVPAKVVAEAQGEVAVDTAYKLTVAQNNVGKTLYFAGEVTDRYLVTTDKADKAVDVFAETAEGGYRLYFTKDGVKTYIEVGFNDANKMSVKLTATPATVYTWNADVDTFVTNVDGTDYYLGCYNQFETISASKTSYINADNVDVSQFPARITVLKTAPVEISIVDTPVAGTTYKFAVAQNNIGKTIYFSGEVSDRYLVTDNRLSKAVDVTVEDVDGAYRLYFTKDGVKTYVEAGFNDANKMSVKLTDTPSVAYTWNADFKTFVTNVDGTDYYLGCYNQFETISASKTSYINADNVDVSQFPARLYSVQ